MSFSVLPPSVKLVAAGASNFRAGSDWIGWNRTVRVDAGVPAVDIYTLLSSSDAISLNLSLVTDLVHRARDVGKAISLTILAGNLCGLLAPIITGYVVAGLGSYDWALWIAGILLVIGAVAVGTMTRRVILPAAGPTQIPTGGIRVTA